MVNNSNNILSRMIKPKHIPKEYNFFRLIKVCKNEKYVDDIISGKLYMSTIDNISKIERKELTKGQLDTFEGTEEYWQETENNFIAMDFTRDKCLFKYFEEEPANKKNLVEVHDVKIGQDQNIFKNIFCMYSMWVDTINKNILEISPRIIDSFGDYSAIIVDSAKFIDRYYKAIRLYAQKYNKRYDSAPTLGFVDYVSFKGKGIVPLGIYGKRDSFAYQNEFRFCLDIKENKHDLCYFELGDLSDIVVKVKTKDLVYNTTLQNDKLLIGDTIIRCQAP